MVPARYNQIASIMGVFSVSSLVLRPVTGQLADAYGRKRLMIISVLIFLATPVLYRLGSALWLIAVIQVFYGYAIGGFTIASAAYVTDIAPAQSVSRVIGQLSIAVILAKGLAPFFIAMYLSLAVLPLLGLLLFWYKSSPGFSRSSGSRY